MNRSGKQLAHGGSAPILRATHEAISHRLGVWALAGTKDAWSPVRLPGDPMQCAFLRARHQEPTWLPPIPCAAADAVVLTATDGCLFRRIGVVDVSAVIHLMIRVNLVQVRTRVATEVVRYRASMRVEGVRLFVCADLSPMTNTKDAVVLSKQIRSCVAVRRSNGAIGMANCRHMARVVTRKVGVVTLTSASPGISIEGNLRTNATTRTTLVK